MHALAALSVAFHFAGAAAVPYRTPVALRSTELTYSARSVGDIQQDLGPQLSTGSQIFFPGSSGFENATSRWNAYGQPNISVVVSPTTADDISKIVTYANSMSMPFLAINRGHGSTDTLANCHQGIEIWMENFRDISINADGKSALLGGGVYDDQIMEYLYDHGKRSATGVCGCVGLTGAGIGGGHGRLQGLYGLVADNFIDMNMVLANGSQVNVSETSNPDLFWAMRGAGNNFGIVTHMNYRIYDAPDDQWYYALMHFTQDKLEAVFEALNNMTSNNPPPEMGMILTDFLWDTNVSTTEPVIYMDFNYAGTEADAAPYVNLYKALGPAQITEGTVGANELNSATGTSSEDALCVHGKIELQFAAGLPALNVSNNRAIYEHFKATTTAQPLFQDSFVVFETYAQQAFKAVASDSTAYPHRADNFICTTIIQYEPDSTLDQSAMTLGNDIRYMANAGAGSDHNLTVYVNYAVGSETLEQVYGYEPWRQEKLRNLKDQWDPQGRFSFFEPIPNSA